MDQTNPLEPGMSTGQRIRYFRERRGLSRKVLAGLIGKSEEWVKAVENGRLLPPRLEMLTQIADVLKLGDIADLAGEQPVRVARLFKGPGHPALPAVKEAINWYPFGRDQEPPPLDDLEVRLATAS
jgi:transcriptional regulator with XRE-family HTH domain